MRLPVVALLVGIVLFAGRASALDLDSEFAPWKKILGVQTVWNHYGPRLGNNGAVIQTWNISGEVGIIPFGVIGSDFLSGYFQGALEVGLTPLFEHFQTKNQNFGGMGLKLRYYLTHFAFGRFVPWVEGNATPGGTDLSVSRVPGPFMFVIQGGFGLSYFLSENKMVYFGYEVQHISNAWTHSNDAGLNSPAGIVLGVSWLWP